MISGVGWKNFSLWAKKYFRRRGLLGVQNNTDKITDLPYFQAFGRIHGVAVRSMGHFSIEKVSKNSTV